MSIVFNNAFAVGVSQSGSGVTIKRIYWLELCLISNCLLDEITCTVNRM